MDSKEVTLSIDSKTTLSGNLLLPKAAKGLVLFVHGSGSSRLSPRNQFVAEKLAKKNIATLLFDLLTHEEEKIDGVTAELRFNIDFLTERLLSVTSWVKKQKELSSLHIGYFGASTGAAAALCAAALEPDNVHAVVSRGGRPDLAGGMLEKVKAPTLLIVGGNDDIVIELNKKAQLHLKCSSTLEIVPHATHLFEESGTLEKVADLAANWFSIHFHS